MSMSINMAVRLQMLAYTQRPSYTVEENLFSSLLIIVFDIVINVILCVAVHGDAGRM